MAWLFVVLLLAAPVSATENVTTSGTLVWARGGDSVGLDPAHEDDGESLKVCDNIFDTLVRYKPESTELEPGLATSWEIAEDGLTYTFHLRQGVKFHDGTPFDANAVLFSLDRQRLSEHPFARVGGPYKYWANMGLTALIANIEKVDASTVKFHLTRPEAPFLSDLGMNFCSIVSPTALKKHKEKFNFHPVGTGPFRFESWEKDSKIVLKANPDYWDGAPPLDTLIFRAIPDNSARLLELQSGGVQGMDFPNPEEMGAIARDPNVAVLTQTGMNVCYLGMNTKKKPFDNVLVRRAVNYAIPKKLLVEKFWGGLAEPAKSCLPPVLWGYADDLPEYDYNVAMAKKLLAKAGYPNGIKTTLWVMDVPRPYLPSPRKVSQAIQLSLGSAGIQTTIVTYEWGTFLDKTDHGEHEMLLMGWNGDNGDPDNFLYILLDREAAKIPATNLAFWENETLHGYLMEAKHFSDREKRAEFYRKAQHLFHEEAPWVPLAHSQQLAVVRKSVKGFLLHPTAKHNFHKVRVEQE